MQVTLEQSTQVNPAKENKVTSNRANRDKKHITVDRKGRSGTRNSQKSAQSPILEVDEERTSKKKNRKKSKESTSPEDYRRGKKLKMIYASSKHDHNRTTGFDGSRRVEFSDTEHIVEGEARSFAAIKSQSTRRHRKPALQANH